MSWSRIVNTTIAEYVRGEEINILRNRKLLAMLKQRGRITFGHSGTEMDWKVRYKRTPMQGYADSDTLTFARRDRWKTAVLPWRGYAATDSMTKLEKLQNSDTQAIVKVYSQIAEMLMEDIEEQFGDELYVDGNASGNSKRIHGFESALSVSGAATQGFIGTNNDTYAGLVTTLGNYGGSWSSTGGTTDWPSGTGDAHYDFWTPLVVDYTDTAWAASTKTFINTGKEAIRFGILKGKKNRTKRGQLDLILLNDELYRAFLELIDDNERMVVKRGDSKDGLYALGFTDVVNFDGVDVTYEYGVPATVGYGLALDFVELCSLQKQMFVPEGPDFDIASQSWRLSIDHFGNMKMNPRALVKWDNIT